MPKDPKVWRWVWFAFLRIYLEFFFYDNGSGGEDSIRDTWLSFYGLRIDIGALWRPRFPMLLYLVQYTWSSWIWLSSLFMHPFFFTIAELTNGGLPFLVI